MKVNVVTRPCMMCGKTSEMVLDFDKVTRWQRGEFVQDVFPELSAAERELLISGTHGPCWDAM